MAYQDHYTILGVDPKASADEIKRAYRRLALATHPDRHPDQPEAEERFRQISTAYAVLSDPAQRARFDTMRHLPEAFDRPQEMTLQTAKDLLSAVFGDVLGRQRRQRKRGRDVRYTLTVDFAEAILGAEKEIRFEALGPCSTCEGSGEKKGGRGPLTCSLCGGRGEIKGEGLFAPWTPCGRCGGMGLIHQDPCERCRGRGARREPRAFRVRIPPGTESGAERVVNGQGEPGYFGGEPGNLRVTINVREDPWLRRDGQEIHVELRLSLSEAARGGKVPVPTVGGDVSVEIPPGVAHGARLRLRGKGVPQEKGRPGDQIVTIAIETPRLDALATGTPARAELEAILARLDALADEHPGLLPQRSAQRRR
ncbi:MAG: J domain-containing protein [Myxococcales bacterium]|nr:J domain-containing protein [Myxococcales bacterium]